MSETPKKKPKTKEDESDEHDKSTWGVDQQRREYYYDDAHGYEIYQPEKEDEEDEMEAQ